MNNESLRPDSQVFHSPVDTGAKETLSQKEELYKEALDSLPFGVILLDETSRIERTNLTAQQMFAASIATRKMLGSLNERTTGFYFMAPIVVAEPKKFKELMDGKCDSYELLHVQRYAGASRNTRFSMQAVQNPSGGRQILAVAKDITKQVEIFDFVQHEIKGKVTSPRGYIQFIKSRVEKAGNISSSALKAVKETNDVMNDICRVTQRPSIYEEITSGSEKPAVEEKSPYPFGKSGLNEFIFNNLPFGVAVLDNVGHVRLSNPYLRESSGLNPARLSFARLPYMLSGTDTSWYEELKTGERTSYDHIHHTPGGSVRFEFLRVEDGSTELIAIAEDVTGEVKAIDQLRKDYLAKIKALQESAGQMDEITIGPALKALVTSFNRGLINLRQCVISNLEYPLSYEAAQRKPLKVNSLLADVYSEVKPQLELEGIIPILELNDTPEIIADERQLKESFANLVHNAIHSMMEPDRPIKKLRIYCGMSKKNPDKIEIEVSDTGVGIPKEDADKIYQHGFTRGKNVKHLQDKGVEGTGFGLSQVRSALRHYGGSIYHVSLTKEEIQKNPDKYSADAIPGTTFYIELHVPPQQ